MNYYDYILQKGREMDVKPEDEPNFEDMKQMNLWDWQNYLNEEPPLNDNEEEDVYSPKHYMTFPDEEAIDLIEKMVDRREFIGYLKCSFLKYKLRAGDKDDAMKDLAKAKWFQEELFAKTEEYNNEG